MIGIFSEYRFALENVSLRGYHVGLRGSCNWLISPQLTRSDVLTQSFWQRSSVLRIGSVGVLGVERHYSNNIKKNIISNWIVIRYNDLS